MKLIVTLTAIVILASCGGKSSAEPSVPPRVSLPPTATEVFHLRSECAALGQKILEGNVIGRALTQDQVSHYDPVTNRCYVQLTVQPADLSKAPPDYYATYLYDGQTGEMLAWAKIEHDKKYGMVFGDVNPSNGHDPDAFWNHATDYINAKMNDDRKN